MVLALSKPEDIVNHMVLAFTKPQTLVNYMVLALSKPKSIRNTRFWLADWMIRRAPRPRVPLRHPAASLPSQCQRQSRWEAKSIWELRDPDGRICVESADL